jgi:hypothetical protein
MMGRMSLVLLILLGILLTVFFLNRNMPRAGGKIGRRRAIDPPTTFPDGISRAFAREVTIFTASSDAAGFSTLKAFLRHGTTGRPILMRIFRVARCKTEIEIPAAPPDYERIDAADALALLRELPDLRLIRRLHLSDERSFLDPWVRKQAGQDFFVLGNATNFKLVVLFKPDRRQLRTVGLTLLHEWLHIVAFASTIAFWRFRRADAAEPPPALGVEPVAFRVRNAAVYEAWSELGEKLFGYDETIARDAALAAPVHAMILWRRVEKILRRTPRRFHSTRFAEFEARAAFIAREVAQKARVARAARRRWWKFR